MMMLGAAAIASEVKVWRAEEIHWQRVEKDGTKYAVLEGDRDQAGVPFTYAFYMPDGAWVKPHFHSQEARVVVVKGTLLLGEGAVFDKASAKALAAGTTFYVGAKAPHYEGAKGETLIIGVGRGGWKTTNLE